MKKILLAALAAFALLAVSCTDEGNGSVDDSMLTSTTWYMVGEDYHPIIATFEKNGKYTWEYGGISGVKDTGTYTITGNVITMNISDFWEIETDWIDGVPGPVEGSEWVKTDAEYTKDRPKTRTATIYVQEARFLIWGVENDWFMQGDGNMLVFMSDDKNEMHADKSVSQSDLQGEWEGRDADGTLGVRLIIDGNRFTLYTLESHYDYNQATQETTERLYVMKDTGTLSLSGTQMTITLEKEYSSMKYEQIAAEAVYTFSEYDPATLEPTEWLSENTISYDWEFFVYRDGINLYYGMSMHGAALKKKN